MTTPTDPDTLRSGAQHVDETEQLGAGYSASRDISAGEINPEERAATHEAPVKTNLGELTLSMFTQGSSTRVRVGNAHSSAELYEYAFDTPDDANTAMIDAGILTPDQVPDMSKPVGTGLSLHGITVEQLEAAGLKRHGSSTL